MKSLEKFISVKRSSFSRFWFLSNESILKLLSNSNDLSPISHLLCTMFGNIEEFIQTDEGEESNINCLVSNDGERLPISNVKFNNVVPDVWLAELEEYIKYYVMNDINSFASVDLRNQESEDCLNYINKYLGQSNFINSNIQ